MRINIKNPPKIESAEDIKKLNSWLSETATLINLGFQNISEENLSRSLKSKIEEVK